ncbi:MAG: hypothetical protein N3A66_08980, partial [Planctomycetota bacterium]|nr:hypothetical protein [Planctomycetota bacterium]
MRKTASAASDELLATRVGALALANPILAASGTYGSGAEYADQTGGHHKLPMGYRRDFAEWKEVQPAEQAGLDHRGAEDGAGA